MSFDPEKFGEAMADLLERHCAPLRAEISQLRSELAQKANVSDIPKLPAPIELPDVAALVSDAVKSAVAELPPAKNGKDCDMDVVASTIKNAVAEAVKAIPKPKDGEDGKSLTVSDVEPLIRDAVNKAVAAIPPAKDGLGVAGAMIDRDGALQITLSNGEVKNLGPVVGRDGISLESFDLEYLPESHEVEIKARSGDRVKSVRYYAGGIRAAGYWRDGKSVKAGEAWSYGGNTWIATKDGTTETPQAGAKDWYLAARRGKDAETVVRHIKPDQPIKLGA